MGSFWGRFGFGRSRADLKNCFGDLKDEMLTCMRHFIGGGGGHH